MRLTIADLVLLDREWSNEDRYHSTELIDGHIYHTPARYVPRVRATMGLYEVLQAKLNGLPSPLQVLTRVSVEMPPHDLPLPDVVVFDAPPGDGFVACSCVPLVSEVCETGLEYFLGAKLQCYARMGIPEYWLIDIGGRTIHQFWTPNAKGYDQVRELALGDRFEAATIAGLTVETGGLV